MPRIGILTRHIYPNYGSLLQAYALQQAFQQFGADCSVIDYVRREDRGLELAKTTLRVSRYNDTRIRRSVYLGAQVPALGLMSGVFRVYQRKLLNMTEPVTNPATIASDFDAVVAGSDQVWNRIRGKLDPNYFLSGFGGGARKHSYAASLGSSRPLVEDSASVLEMLTELDSVSVREATAKLWLADNGVEAREDIDPTLLHGAKYWSDFAGPPRTIRPFILAYQLHQSSDFARRLEEAESIHRIPVIRVTPDIKHVVRRGRTKVAVSPRHWVSLFRDASLVVTDSFHGTAFSLRFGTPAYVVLPNDYGTRITDILAAAGAGHIAVSPRRPSLSGMDPHFDHKTATERIDARAAISRHHVADVASSAERALDGTRNVTRGLSA